MEEAHRAQSECPVSGPGLGLRASAVLSRLLPSGLQQAGENVNPVLPVPQDKVTAMWGGEGSSQVQGPWFAGSTGA